MYILYQKICFYIDFSNYAKVFSLSKSPISKFLSNNNDQETLSIFIRDVPKFNKYFLSKLQPIKT